MTHANLHPLSMRLQSQPVPRSYCAICFLRIKQSDTIGLLCEGVGEVTAYIPVFKESNETMLLTIVSSTGIFDTVPSDNKWSVTLTAKTKLSSGTFHVPFLAALRFRGNL